MPRGRRLPRTERARAARGVLWVAVFSFVAVMIRHDRAQLRRFLERVHISAASSAHVVSIAAAACVALAGIWVVATLFHAVAWARAARQERWLLDDRRAMSVPPLARHLQVLP